MGLDFLSTQNKPMGRDISSNGLPPSENLESLLLLSLKRGREREGGNMEQWRPLFELLLSSPSPETAAERWFDSQHHRQPSASPLTSSFLTLLLSPVVPSSSSSSVVFIQTLPPFLQSRILSFLSSHRLRFDSRKLHSVAAVMVGFGGVNFWVKCAARNLLDEMPEGALPKDSFFDLPPWLREAVVNETPLLPWLPFEKSKLPERRTRHLHVPADKHEFESVSSVLPSPLPKKCPSLSNHDIERAVELSKEIRTVESVPEAINLAEKIQNVCVETQNPMEVLGLTEPWEINDDLVRVLVSNISVEPSLVLSSLLLPKLLTLQTQPSSPVLSATLEVCKNHPVEAVDSLLFPLIFRIDGLNMPLCDLITKVTKDCMHPLHISFFIQRLLCAEGSDMKSVCLPQHREHISTELVWNEALFQLLYTMINRDKDVILTPNAVEKLVLVIGEMAMDFAKSLKFGSFFLCFVNRCGDRLTSHKDFLRSAAQKTDSFVTKAIMVSLQNI